MALKKGKKSSLIRKIVQIFFFVLVALIALNHTLAESGIEIPLVANASLHAVCPVGGVVSIHQFVTQGTFVKKIHESSMVLLGIVLVLGALFGPVFCGWICPFGSFQEFLGGIGRKIFRKRYNTFFPKKLDSVLRYLRYVVLALVLYMTARSGQLVFEGVDPYYALFNFWTGEVAITAYVVFGFTILLSLFVERPFCKYACPFGAVLGLTNLFRIFGIKRNPATCIGCKACDKACPMNIEVSGKGTVRDHQCIGCMKCTSEQSCPVPGTVELAAGKFEPVTENAEAAGGKK